MIAFRELYPTAQDADLAALYRPPGRPNDQRHVRVNMIASLDGATAQGGTSGSLGDAADRLVFATLRSYADVVVVGAGTMRAERYGPAQPSPTDRDARRERGQAPVPPIAVITRSADLDWATPFFTEAEVPPIVITVEASRDAARHTSAAVEVVIAGDDEVDLAVALDELTRRGHHDVLVEGGPTINAALAARRVLDEVCVTVAPTLVAGPSQRILAGPVLEPAIGLRLASVITADGYLFVRYCREGDAGASG
jgi:riboflavin biosynthesis pyrimidine reductase